MLILVRNSVELDFFKDKFKDILSHYNKCDIDKDVLEFVFNFCSNNKIYNINFPGMNITTYKATIINDTSIAINVNDLDNNCIIIISKYEDGGDAKYDCEESIYNLLRILYIKINKEIGGKDNGNVPNTIEIL